MTDSSEQQEMGHSVSLRGITVARRGPREIVSFNQDQGADTATGVLATDLESTAEDV